MAWSSDLLSTVAHDPFFGSVSHDQWTSAKLSHHSVAFIGKPDVQLISFINILFRTFFKILYFFKCLSFKKN